MGKTKRRREFEMQKPQDRLGDAPIEARYHDQMTAIVRALDETLNQGKSGNDRETGFVLMVFPFNSNGRCNYMSNGANRQDVITLMREMIARFEGQPELKGTA
jgi:hypothetical protein